MSPTLGLDYAPNMNSIVLARLEDAARRTGLPLAEVELLGQCEATALGFVAAVDSGDTARFLDRVDWDRLEGLLGERDVFAPGVGPYVRLGP